MPGRYKVAAKEDRTADNILFDSGWEMQQYLQFKTLLNCGAIANLELQKAFPLFGTDETGAHVSTISHYVADFVVTEKNGVVRIYETKGHKDSTYKMKFKWFHVSHPSLRIVELHDPRSRN